MAQNKRQLAKALESKRIPSLPPTPAQQLANLQHALDTATDDSVRALFRQLIADATK